MSSRSPFHGAKALVVDDNVTNCWVLARLLQSFDMVADYATSVEATQVALCSNSKGRPTPSLLLVVDLDLSTSYHLIIITTSITTTTWFYWICILRARTRQRAGSVPLDTSPFRHQIIFFFGEFFLYTCCWCVCNKLHSFYCYSSSSSF